MPDLTPTLKTLLPRIRELIVSARHAAARTVNTLQVVTNYEIGRLIVEHEQQGEKRARYGKALLKELSASLSAEFGRGFSEDNLSNMRRFYLEFRDRLNISETTSRKSESMPKRPRPSNSMSISETVSGQFILPERLQQVVTLLELPLRRH